MKRRNILKSIVVVSAGAVIFPKCKPNEVAPAIPSYDNLAIEEPQFNLLQAISEQLLPTKDIPYETPEPTNEYILTMMNDVHSTEDSERYVNGLNQLSELIQVNYNKSFTKLTPEEKDKLFKYLSEIKNYKNPLKYFFDTTLGYSKQHFMSSEYYLTEQLDWKFIPGGYDGAARL